MAAKRATATILLFVAFIAVAGFVFLLFANANDLDVPGANDLDAVAIVALVLLGIIALVYILMLAIRQSDVKTEQAEEAEAFFIPEEDQKRTEAKQQAAVAQAMSKPSHGKPAPAYKPRSNEVDAADLAGVPLGSQTWSGPEGNVYSFHYPRPANTGLFSNDYVDIGGGQQVKVATLLAAPGHAFAGAVEEPITPSSIQ